jgi:hypothetical protein
MGTWGPGPLDNDTADDLIDELQELPPPGRVARLSDILQAAVTLAAQQRRPALPDQVLAAAAIVGANTPRGAAEEWLEDNEAVADWLAPPVAPQTAALAAQALEAALPPDSWYWSSWTDPDDRQDAEDTYRSLLDLLRQHAQS